MAVFYKIPPHLSLKEWVQHPSLIIQFHIIAYQKNKPKKNDV